MNSVEKQTILHKEIDLIQGCISRMAQNQFVIKGWYISIIIVISAWKMNEPKVYIALVCLCSLLFYIIDLQFYIYEKKFRMLYQYRLEARCVADNFNKKDIYSLKPPKLTFCEWIKLVFRNYMLIFMYGGFCIILVIGNFYINSEKNKKDNDVIKIEIRGLNEIVK